MLKLNPYNVVNTVGSTDLEYVKTIEHLLCSLFLHKIDNILIEIIGQEIPILDGSITFFNEIFDKNWIELPKKAHTLKIPSFFEIENSFFKESEMLEIYCYIQDHKTKEKSFLYWNESSPLIAAKTYGYIQDYYIFQNLNLGKGSNIYNTKILSLYKNNLNKYEINYHKIIDFLGDLYTTNIPYIRGTFFLCNPNHTLNNKIAKKVYDIFQNKTMLKEER
ncbi:MAG: UDP-3-O-acyl-N-acetylglucosamine deacetylase [bacterium]